MGRPDFAAAADDVSAGLDPADRLVGIGIRIEVVAGVQHFHCAAMLERLDRGEAVGIGANRPAESDQFGQRGSDRFGPAAIDQPCCDRQAVESARRRRYGFAAAQPWCAVIGERPRHPHRLAAFRRGGDRRARFLGRRHGLAQEQIDAVGLLGNDAAVDVERILEGYRQCRCVAAEQGRQAAGDRRVAGLVASLPCQFYAALLQRLEQLFRAFARQPLGGCGVGVDGDDAGAGPNEFRVQVAHQVRFVDQHPGRP